jgi:excinuclease UvrABC nuclease subunit
LKFDAYKASGTEEQRRTAEEKLAFAKPAGFFLERIRKIDKRLTLLVIGMMSCPDCTVVYPYLEAMEAANPFISVRYLVRDNTPDARKFMSYHTGRTNTPSIFVVRNGKVLNGAYVETPSRVTALLEAAKNKEERNEIWKDFHSGVYDEDIQSDLLELISNIDD